MPEKVFYKGLDILTKSEPDIKKKDRIEFCLYSISRKQEVVLEKTDYDNPFLEFLLYRESSKLSLPSIINSTDTPSKECMRILTKMFNGEIKIKYVGYISNILFFETERIYSMADFIEKSSLLWFVNVDDIINYRGSLHYDIDQNIRDLMLKNSELIYLVDENNNNLETPVTAYYGKSLNKVKAISVFGADKANYKASLGPFYYYGTLNRAIRYGCWSSDYKETFINGIPITDKEGKYNEGGIVKFVLFTGSINMSFTRRGEKTSGFKKIIKGVEDSMYSGFDTIKEKDKLWITNFDTIILDRTTNMDDPQFVIRSSKNEIPIAYYGLDTRNVVREKLHEITIE
tara:strand:- start:2201 stop:3232 length:1032 start_codon:yes stop_codon:yes gene_type:complete